MESTGPVSYPVSFRKKPRRGQQKVFDRIASSENGERLLNAQLPTGYGKTFTFCGAYAIKRAKGETNRMLAIFPTDGQLDQFEKDGPRDLLEAGVEENRSVVDIRYFGAHAIGKHRKNEAQVYAITAQALIQPRGMDNVRALMDTGRWMIVVDEYHHYGIGKAWGEAVKALPAAYLLAMSATPTRPDDDSAFGHPHIVVTYREAYEEGVVKELIGHSYNYRIDAIGEDKVLRSFTTQELVDEVGSSSPEDIEKFRVERRMRWSPKYVSPLVSIPIQRMQRERISRGQPRLQALIGAMCVSHAQLVCEQIRAMFPELDVDWIGTGPNGRPDNENKTILNKFCPKKDEYGRRAPILDVLVHVGMAGEGLDSMHVSEVVHLNRASKNNTNDQENGRASRFLMGGDSRPVQGNINFDSCSEYAVRGYVGTAIMDAMDGVDPTEKEDDAKDPVQREFDWPELPDEPIIQILDMELESIDSGHPDVVLMKQALVQTIKEYSESDLADPHSSVHEAAFQEYKKMRRDEAEQFNERSRIVQLRENVNGALSAVAGLIVRMTIRNGQRFDKSLPGDIKYRINVRKKIVCGEITEAEDVCRRHYQWLKKLERELMERGIPEWLQ